MKIVKRFAAAIIAAVLVLAMCVSAFAATITVTGGQDGQVYYAYLIFDLQTSQTAAGATGYTYSIDDDSQFYNIVKTYADTYGTLTLSEISQAGGVTTYEVTVDTSAFSAADFAAYLKEIIDADIAAGGTTYTATATATASIPQGATNAEASLTANEAGYYFINSDLGTLAILRSSYETITVSEKNTAPTVDKKAKEDSETDYGENVTAKIGDTIDYQVVVNVGAGETGYDIIINDTLSKGLTLVCSDTSPYPMILTVTDSDGNTWTSGTDYTAEYVVNTDGTTKITITLLADTNTSTGKLSSLVDGSTVTVTYSAVINEYATSTTTNPNTNEASVTYGRDSGYTSQTDVVDTYTYRFGIEKTDGVNKLSGAVFTISTDESGTNLLQFVQSTTTAQTNNSYYHLATADEIKAGSSSEYVTTSSTYQILYLTGLEPGTYYVTEYTAPNGYNKLQGTIKVVIDENGGVTFYYLYNGGETQVDAYGSVTDLEAGADAIEVVNNAGSTLPNAGGIGTRIFYVVGGVLVIGAGVLLIAKRRMSSDK